MPLCKPLCKRCSRTSLPSLPAAPSPCAGMMFVLLYGRKGLFAPLIASGILPPIVFAFPGAFVQRAHAAARACLDVLQMACISVPCGCAVHAAVSCCHHPSALDAFPAVRCNSGAAVARLNASLLHPSCPTPTLQAWRWPPCL